MPILVYVCRCIDQLMSYQLLLLNVLKLLALSQFQGSLVWIITEYTAVTPRLSVYQTAMLKKIHKLFKTLIFLLLSLYLVLQVES